MKDIVKNLYNVVNIKRQDLLYCSKQCILRDTPHVFFDYYGDYNNIDIIFLGINPGKDEIKWMKPFVGRSGTLLRDYLEKYIRTYFILNVIFGHTPNTSSKEFKSNYIDIMNHCSIFSNSIIDSLTSIKYIVSLGEIPLTYLANFYFKDDKLIDIVKYRKIKYSKFNNLGIYMKNDRKFNVINIPHPSYIVRGMRLDIYDYCFWELVKLCRS